jgi:P27 family predicted phage terminase small subunit
MAVSAARQMTRGRKPLPTQLKILNGNPGKRPLNMDEPDVEVAIPEPPACLDELALEEWNRIGSELMHLGVISNIDRCILAAYSMAWSRAFWAQQQLAEQQLVLTGKDGGVYQNPLLAIFNKAMEQAVKYAAELGMTPSSRSRIKVNPQDSRNASSIMDFVSQRAQA